MSGTRVAAVDCGTNSLRLLVAERDGGRLRDVVRRMEIVRLGAGVDRTGYLAPEALARTFDVLGDYAGEIERHGAQRVRLVATSATRDAANRDAFTAGVQRLLGIVPDVVSGAAEAKLSFLGATREFAGQAEGAARAAPVRRSDRRAPADREVAGQAEEVTPAAPPYLVVDIGGGSTEFVLGSTAPTAALSVDVGCVRLAERHFAADPPMPSQVAAATADVERALDRVATEVPVAGAASLVGLAGTVTTIAGIALRLPAYDPARIHHAVLGAADLRRITDELLRADRATRAALPVMHPGRVDVIAAGALVLDRVIRRFGFQELVVSEHDILDGIAWSLLDAGSQGDVR